MPIWWGNTTTGTTYIPVGLSAQRLSTIAWRQAILGTPTQTTSSTPYFEWLGGNSTTTTATTAASNSTFYVIEEDNWVDHIQYVALAQQRVIRTQERTAEQQREYEALSLRHQQEQLRFAQERATALARSKELLLAHLTPAQRKTLEEKRWFVVEGGKSKQLYRIKDTGSYSANVEVLEGKPGKVTHRLCCHLQDSRVPLYDHLLAQKVWIESDEDAFVRQANRHAA